MSLKKYLSLMSVITIITWGVFVFIVLNIDPEVSNWLGFLLFYFSLFIPLSGSLTIIGFLIRKRFSKKIMNTYLIKTSFRQSFLFSFLVVSILFMLAESLFSWLNIAILIIALSIIEYVLINEKK
jgi:hypothetical protein